MNPDKLPPEESGTLSALVEAGARIRPFSEEERGQLLARLQALAARPAPRRRAHVIVPLTVAATVLGGILIAVAPRRVHPTSGDSKTVAGRQVEPPMAAPSAVASPLRERQRSISLAGRGEITLERDTVAYLTSQSAAAGIGPQTVEIQRGRLLADVATRAADEALSIVTPHLVVVVVGTRFVVTVDPDITAVAVQHGRVRVERDGQTVFVGAGESIRSDDDRFAPPIAVAPTQPSPVRRGSPAPQAARCTAEAESGARARCLRRLARGNGLAAENALLSLSLLERNQHADGAAALAWLEEYERRFSHGTLTREVALIMVRTLVEQGEHPKACAYAENYAGRFPEDQNTLARLRTRCAR